MLFPAIIGAIDYHMSQVWTAIPGVVVGFNFDAQSVDVKPAIDAQDEEGNTYPRPTIPSVPLVYPCSSLSAITFPVAVGDTVLLVFSARGLDAFKSNGSSKPVDFRQHSMRDAIAIPGLATFASPATKYGQEKDALVITHNLNGEKCDMHFLVDGSIKVFSPKTFSVEAKDIELKASNGVTVDSQTTALNSSAGTTMSAASIGMTATTGAGATMTGKFTMNGQFTQVGPNSFNGISVDQHKHTGVQTGGSTSGLPV